MVFGGLKDKRKAETKKGQQNKMVGRLSAHGLCSLIKKEQWEADKRRAVTKAVGETASQGVFTLDRVAVC